VSDELLTYYRASILAAYMDVIDTGRYTSAMKKNIGTPDAYVTKIRNDAAQMKADLDLMTNFAEGSDDYKVHKALTRITDLITHGQFVNAGSATPANRLFPTTSYIENPVVINRRGARVGQMNQTNQNAPLSLIQQTRAHDQRLAELAAIARDAEEQRRIREESDRAMAIYQAEQAAFQSLLDVFNSGQQPQQPAPAQQQQQQLSLVLQPVPEEEPISTTTRTTLRDLWQTPTPPVVPVVPEPLTSPPTSRRAKAQKVKEVYVPSAAERAAAADIEKLKDTQRRLNEEIYARQLRSQQDIDAMNEETVRSQELHRRELKAMEASAQAKQETAELTRIQTQIRARDEENRLELERNMAVQAEKLRREREEAKRQYDEIEENLRRSQLQLEAETQRSIMKARNLALEEQRKLEKDRVETKMRNVIKKYNRNSPLKQTRTFATGEQRRETIEMEKSITNLEQQFKEAFADEPEETQYYSQDDITAMIKEAVEKEGIVQLEEEWFGDFSKMIYDAQFSTKKDVVFSKFFADEINNLSMIAIQNGINRDDKRYTELKMVSRGIMDSMKGLGKNSNEFKNLQTKLKEVEQQVMALNQKISGDREELAYRTDPERVIRNMRTTVLNSGAHLLRELNLSVNKYTHQGNPDSGIDERFKQFEALLNEQKIREGTSLSRELLMQKGTNLSELSQMLQDINKDIEARDLQAIAQSQAHRRSRTTAGSSRRPVAAGATPGFMSVMAAPEPSMQSASGAPPPVSEPMVVVEYEDLEEDVEEDMEGVDVEEASNYTGERSRAASQVGVAVASTVQQVLQKGNPRQITSTALRSLVDRLKAVGSDEANTLAGSFAGFMADIDNPMISDQQKQQARHQAFDLLFETFQKDTTVERKREIMDRTSILKKLDKDYSEEIGYSPETDISVMTNLIEDLQTSPTQNITVRMLMEFVKEQSGEFEERDIRDALTLLDMVEKGEITSLDPRVLAQAKNLTNILEYYREQISAGLETYNDPKITTMDKKERMELRSQLIRHTVTPISQFSHVMSSENLKQLARDFNETVEWLKDRTNQFSDDDLFTIYNQLDRVRKYVSPEYFQQIINNPADIEYAFNHYQLAPDFNDLRGWLNANDQDMTNSQASALGRLEVLYNNLNIAKSQWKENSVMDMYNYDMTGEYGFMDPGFIHPKQENIMERDISDTIRLLANHTDDKAVDYLTGSLLQLMDLYNLKPNDSLRNLAYLSGLKYTPSQVFVGMIPQKMDDQIQRGDFITSVKMLYDYLHNDNKLKIYDQDAFNIVSLFNKSPQSDSVQLLHQYFMESRDPAKLVKPYENKPYSLNPDQPLPLHNDKGKKTYGWWLANSFKGDRDSTPLERAISSTTRPTKTPTAIRPTTPVTSTANVMHDLRFGRRFPPESKYLPGTLQTPRPVRQDESVLEQHYKSKEIPKIINHDETNLFNHVNVDLFDTVMKEIEVDADNPKPESISEKRIRLESSYTWSKPRHVVGIIPEADRYKFMKAFVRAKISQKLAVIPNVNYRNAHEYLTFQSFKGFKPLKATTPAPRQAVASTPLGAFAASTPTRRQRPPDAVTPAGSPPDTQPKPQRSKKRLTYPDDK